MLSQDQSTLATDVVRFTQDMFALLPTLSMQLSNTLINTVPVPLSDLHYACMLLREVTNDL